MEIKRVFVAPGTDPFSMFEYEKWDCVLKDFKTGKVISEQKQCEVPKKWGVLSRKILVTKYFRRAGVPKQLQQINTDSTLPPFLRRHVGATGCTYTGETSVKQTIHRIVGHWTYTGFKSGYFAPGVEQQQTLLRKAPASDPAYLAAYADAEAENALAYYDEMAYMMLSQMAAPNSPQWFNTGLWWAYGIEGKGQGHYYVDLPANTKSFAKPETYLLHTDVPKYATVISNQGKIVKVDTTEIATHNYCLKRKLVESESAYKHVQAHACFILSLEDTMCGDNGILDFYEREGRIFKYGSGSGTNASKLRGRNEKLSGGGTSSGVMSWLKVADYGAGAIKSGGTTRRAAKMAVLDLDHPDIEEFINCKVVSETAVSAMVTGAKIVNAHCQAIMNTSHDAKKSNFKLAAGADDAGFVIRDARKDGVTENHIQAALAMAESGETKWPGINWTSSFQGTDSAYEVVPFQNTNHSVRIPQRFYQQVDSSHWWDAINRTDGKIAWSKPAREIEHEIAVAGWFCGDPGAQYTDNINDMNTCANDGTINASNPCSEYLHLDDTACNLASMKATAFVKEDGTFDIARFRHASHLWTIALDITNSMANLPSPEVALGTFNYRTIGLGYCDLGAYVMSLGLPYDSNEARAVAAAITALMHSQSILTSAQLAQELGAYPRYWANKEHHDRVVHNHQSALIGTSFKGMSVLPTCLDIKSLEVAVGALPAFHFLNEATSCFEEARKIAEQYGYRNAQNTLLAPTGTIGLLMDCSTTGVEPVLGLVVYKELVGGNMEVLVPPILEKALQKLGYNNTAIPKIIESIKNSQGQLPLGKWTDDDGCIGMHHQSVFQTSLSNDPNNPAIRWEAHILMMAAVQPFLSGAISKTINMPVESTIDDVKRAYRMAHDHCLKAVALYRDNCKLSQPMQMKKAEQPASHKHATAAFATPDLLTKMIVNHAVELQKPAPGEVPKALFSSPSQLKLRHLLPSIRTCGIDVAVKFGDGHLYVKTSKYPDGKVGEIWITYSADQGIINALITNLCKTANVALQYGVPLSAVLSSWSDSVFEPSGMVGGHPNFRMAKSIVNLAAKLIGFHELGDDTCCDSPPTTPEAEGPAPQSIHVGYIGGGVVTAKNNTVSDGDPRLLVAEDHVFSDTTGKWSHAKEFHIPTERCSRCGRTRWRQTGTCKTCTGCGEAGGCG